MLSEELFKIKSARQARLDGDAEGDDVHHWRLRLGCFSTSTPLGADLADLARRYPGTGADTVELRLKFKADLFPFYPPSVDIVRPRLLGPVRGALVAHPLLRLDTWDPITPCAAVVDRLRSFLELHGRVDLQADANNPATHPDGAHSDTLSRLDGALAQMGALHSCIPDVYVPLYEAHMQQHGSGASLSAMWPRVVPEDELASPPAPGMSVPAPMEVDTSGAASSGERNRDKDQESCGEDFDDSLGAAAAEPEDSSGGRKRKAGDAGRKYYWSKGTGYGYDGDGGGHAERWDPSRAAAAQEAQDDATQRMATHVTQLLQQMRDDTSADTDRNPSSSLRHQAARCIERSALPSLLAKELHGRSIIDMTARSGYFTALLQCIVEASHIGAGTAFTHVAERLNSIETQANLFLRLSTTASAIADSQKTATCGDESKLEQGQPQPQQRQQRLDSDDSTLARLVLDAASALRQALCSTRQTPDEAVATTTQCEANPAVGAAALGRRLTRGALRAAAAVVSPGAVEASCPVAASVADPGKEARVYTASLSALLLDTCPRLSGEHHYRADASKDVPNAAQQRRVAKECAGLVALLPCTPSSSVFVRAEEASTSLWRALITGPEGTPYAGGCFVFDIFFPHAYPSVRVARLMSRRVRFAMHVTDAFWGARVHTTGAAKGEPVHHRWRQGAVQPEPVQLRQGVPVAPGHVAGRQGRGVGPVRQQRASGAGQHPEPHLGRAAVFQRAWLRAVHGHRPWRRHEPRVQRRHTGGHHPVRHAGGAAQAQA